MTELAEKIINFRAKHNLTQVKFASLCKMSPVTIINVEHGKPVSRLTRARIEFVLNGGVVDESE